METASKSNGSSGRIDLEFSHDGVLVGGDDDIDRLNGAGKVLISLLLGKLELKKGTVELVDHDDRTNSLNEGLTKHSLGLHAHTLDAIDNDKGSISDTEGSSDF